MSRHFLHIILAVLFLQTSIGQDYEANIHKAFQELPPQQKVYLHLDKHEYYAGDKIWIKAYIVKADTHMPDTLETTLFVELLNNNGTRIDKKILHSVNGYAYGDMSIPDSVTPGNHYIRAYTDWMLNFSEEFIFERFFFIHNPIGEKIINRSEARANRRINRELEKREESVSIEFYPEGGNLVSGLKNRVAFFAFNKLREGIWVEGFIRNSEGENVATLKTIFQGKGYFEWIPESNTNYYAEVMFPGGESKTVPIKGVKNDGYNLRINRLGEVTEVLVSSTENVPQDPFYLVVHSRGEIQQMIQLTSAQLPFSLNLQQKELQPGISVASLFNANAKVVAERLFFRPPDPTGKVKFELEKYSDQFYDLRIQSEKFATDSAAYSVSVVAASKIKDPLTENILSHILLASDLQRAIQNPVAYLEPDNYHERADLLMMVSDWKRYRLSEMLDSETKKLTYSRDKKGFQVYGIIIPSKEAEKTGNTKYEISFRYGETGRFVTTQTDNEGWFSFGGIQEHGPFDAEISVTGGIRGAPEFLELFPNRIEESEKKPNTHSRLLLSRATSGWWFSSSGGEPESDRIIRLGKESGLQSYGSPSQVIYLNENESRYHNLGEVLRKNVSGLRVDGNRILLRGTNSIYLSNQPLLMVDGIQHSTIQFLRVPVVEVSKIEIFKGTDAAIFGIRGTNGVIMAFTRKSTIPESVIISYIIDGYYIPRNFNLSDAKLRELFFEDENYTQTIFWNPNILIDKNGSTTLRIPIDYIPPYINVTIEGIDKEGNITHARQEFDLNKPNP